MTTSEEERILRKAIFAWAQDPSGAEAVERFVKIEDAITALDNAAYSRGHAEARQSATDWTDFYIADSDRSGRRIEKMLRQQVDMSVTIGQQGVEIEHLKAERDTLHQQWARCIKEGSARRYERDRLKQELEFAEHRRAQAETEIERLQAVNLDLALRLALREDAMSRALETLADRYHAQVCYRKPRHRRQTCSQPPQAVKDAEKALAGESVDASDDMRLFHGVVDHVATSDRMLTSEEVKAAHRVLFADRKPKEQPEIEAVLMGSEIVCACGCGVTVPAGRCAYRYVKHVLAVPPLYASEACARKAARPKARVHPPYAAYTDEMRREEERQHREVNREAAGHPYSKPPEAPTTPEPEFLYECAKPHGCGWFGPAQHLHKDRCPECLRWRYALRIAGKVR